MKSKLILSLAVGLIIIGLYGIAGSLSRSETIVPIIEAQAQETYVKKLKTWWLKNDVDSGGIVKRSDIEIRYLPEAEANQNGVDTEMTINFTSGAVYGQKLPQSTLLFSDMLVSPQDQGYIDLVLAPDRVPYVLRVPAEAVVGGAISNGMYVDVVALTLPQSRMTIEVGAAAARTARMIGVNPVLLHIKILKVVEQVLTGTRALETMPVNVDIVLELTRKQVAKLTVAKRIAEIEVHKSIGDYTAGDLKADAGDVLPDFKSVTEMRANDVVIK
ncbi:Flp pilus assembly protein RcpC/CpaB [Moritella sp. JT01]|uniref:RcpC/CpaB family pilus assembly protein n=1 Tax=Moritella sp. JT01 TaxID=756698 RepID=UPI0007943AC1|nr:RcpC/CpaB family pilus assembly protein [Moritella sp. JT01]KXO09539.1 Flp pilus assembly protein RcpC/CpaB [Moritella sp. JT01]